MPQPPGLVRRLEAAATGEANPVALDHDLNGVNIVSDGESDRTGYPASTQDRDAARPLLWNLESRANWRTGKARARKCQVTGK